MIIFLDTQTGLLSYIDVVNCKKMGKYWSTQLYRGQEYGHVEKENNPVLPPGFINGDSNTKKSGELVTVEEGFE